MNQPALKDLLTAKEAVFTHYRHNTLFYEVRDPANPSFTPFPFGVPIKDAAGEASFPAKDRSMMFMKWISKQLKLNNEPEPTEPAIEVPEATPEAPGV